jgi:hypothetical protein
LFVLHIILQGKKSFLVSEIKQELLFSISGITDPDLNILAGTQGPFLVPGRFEFISSDTDRNALVAILTPGTKKIISKMAHAVSQQIFKLHLRDILKQVLLKQGFPILKIPALKCSGINKMG